MECQFKYDDKVSVVVARSTHRGLGVSMKVQEATFIRLHPEVEGRAEVKMRNGRCVWVSLDGITPAGERNALTKALCGEA